MANFDPICWRRATQLLTMPEARRILLYGLPGTGKSYGAQHEGLREGERVYSLTLTRESVAVELRGMYLPSGADGVWRWHDGPTVEAMRTSAEGSPVRLIINELDRASEDAHSFLLSVLDGSDVALETLPTGETITAGDNLRVIATMNGQPTALPDALSDRLTIQLNVDAPAPAAIARLPEAYRKAAIGTVANADERRRVSLRSWYSFCELAPALGEAEAAAVLWGDRAGLITDGIEWGRAASSPSAAIPADEAGAAVIGKQVGADGRTYYLCACGLNFRRALDYARHCRYCPTVKATSS